MAKEFFFSPNQSPFLTKFNKHIIVGYKNKRTTIMMTEPRKKRKPFTILTNTRTDEKRVVGAKRVIKFIGNMTDNINEILREIPCSCGCTEFR